MQATVTADLREALSLSATLARAEPEERCLLLEKAIAEPITSYPQVWALALAYLTTTGYDCDRPVTLDDKLAVAICYGVIKLCRQQSDDGLISPS